MSAYALMPMGQTVLGAIGDVTSVPLTVAAGVAITVAFALAALRAFPEIRKMA